MSDEKDQKEEKVVEEAVEAKEKAEEATNEAEESAKEAKEAEEKTEEIKEEAKEEIKEQEKTDQPVAIKDEPKEEKPAPSGKYKEIIEKIEILSVLELAELVKDLEDRFGVSASAPMMAMSQSPSGIAEGAPAEEEKSSFDLVLSSSGDKKIQVIKAVREIKPDLGLKEAKDLVDSAPKELVKGMKKDEAEEAKKKLEAAGATVELK